MEAIRTHNPLMGTLLLGVLTISMFPTHLSADVITTKRVAILGTFTAALLLCSENAQTLGTKALYNTKMAALRVLKQCSVSSSMEKKCTDWIEESEASYTKRSGNVFTKDNFKALLKEFKELWDATKAGKELFVWLRDVEK
jgi:hypothetical protein